MPSATDANTNILLNELSKPIKLVKVAEYEGGACIDPTLGGHEEQKKGTPVPYHAVSSGQHCAASIPQPLHFSLQQTPAQSQRPTLITYALHRQIISLCHLHDRGKGIER